MKLARRIFTIAFALPIIAICLIADRSSAELTGHASGVALLNGPSVNLSKAHDVSKPLRSLGESEEDRVAVFPVQNPSPVPTPPDMSTPAGAAAIEQRSPGTGPAATLVASFDGLGAAFKGPQGTAILRNPSDNSLAVGLASKSRLNVRSFVLVRAISWIVSLRSGNKDDPRNHTKQHERNTSD